MCMATHPAPGRRRRRATGGGDVVDDAWRRRRPPPGPPSALRVSMETRAIAGEGLDDGQRPAAAPRPSATGWAPGRVDSPPDVDDVGALGDQLPAVGDGRGGIEPAAPVGEGVGRHVERHPSPGPRAPAYRAAEVRPTPRSRRLVVRRQRGFWRPGRSAARPWMKLMASLRAATLSRISPRTAEVTVSAPGLRTPRIDMQRCSASTTTSTPRGASTASMRSATWVVRRSCTWGRLRVAVHQPGQLGQAGDPAVLVRDVGDVGPAEPGHQVVLAHAVHGDVLDHHHLVVVGLEDDLQVVARDPPAARRRSPRTCGPPGGACPRRPSRSGSSPMASEDLPDGALDAGQVDAAGVPGGPSLSRPSWVRPAPSVVPAASDEAVVGGAGHGSRGSVGVHRRTVVGPAAGATGADRGFGTADGHRRSRGRPVWPDRRWPSTARWSHRPGEPDRPGHAGPAWSAARPDRIGEAPAGPTRPVRGARRHRRRLACGR